MLPLRSLSRTGHAAGHHIAPRLIGTNALRIPYRRCLSTPADTLDPKLPLAGIRVLDMTRVLAGPYCTQILGDLGAEVIKIEHPVRGDDTRAWGPPYAPYTAESGKEGPGESAYFLAANRNKKSLAISFQHPRGISILHSLAKTCDVLVENYLPDTLSKYSLDYSTLSGLNPSLIYASITGYGQTGPYRSRAGYDVMVEAEMGLMHITGERHGPPVKVGVAVTDLTTGLYTSNSVMAALIQRGRTGRGQWLDVALSDCQVATLSNLASSALVSGGTDSGRWGTAHPSIVPYKAFPTADSSILLGGGNDRLFGIIADKLAPFSPPTPSSPSSQPPAHPSTWALSPLFSTNSARVANRLLLESLISAITAAHPTAHWLRVLEGSGLPYAAVNDIRGTLDHAHVRARGMVQTVAHPSCGELEVVASPVKWSESRVGVREGGGGAPPTLGEHTDEVLRALGIEGGEVEELRREGVVA